MKGNFLKGHFEKDIFVVSNFLIRWLVIFELVEDFRGLSILTADNSTTHCMALHGEGRMMEQHKIAFSTILNISQVLVNTHTGQSYKSQVL